MTGGIQQSQSNNPLIRAWRAFSACPFRLFTLAALVHTIILFSLVFTDSLPYGAQNSNAILFIAFYGLWSAPVLGALFYWMPRRFQRSPVSYGWYSFSYLLLLIALGLIEAGFLLGIAWTLAGGVLLALAWYMVLHAFKDYSVWCGVDEKPWLRIVNGGVVVLLLGIAVFIMGVLADVLFLSGIATWGLFASGSLLVVIGTMRLHLIKPVNAPGLTASCLASSLQD